MNYRHLPLRIGAWMAGLALCSAALAPAAHARDYHDDVYVFASELRDAKHAAYRAGVYEIPRDVYYDLRRAGISHNTLRSVRYRVGSGGYSAIRGVYARLGRPDFFVVDNVVIFTSDRQPYSSHVWRRALRDVEFCASNGLAGYASRYVHPPYPRGHVTYRKPYVSRPYICPTTRRPYTYSYGHRSYGYSHYKKPSLSFVFEFNKKDKDRRDHHGRGHHDRDRDHRHGDRDRG